MIINSDPGWCTVQQNEPGEQHVFCNVRGFSVVTWLSVVDNGSLLFLTLTCGDRLVHSGNEALDLGFCNNQ